MSSSKSPPLAADFGALARAGRLRGLDRHELLLEGAEAVRDLRPELVERRTEPGGVQEAREARGIAVEVGLQHARDAAERRVPPARVEELVDHRLELAAVAEKCLERSREPAVAIAEVGSEDRLERLGGPLVHGAALVRETVELRADRVHVQRHADALKGGQPDAQRALDEDGVVVGRLRRQPARKRAVVEREALDVDPVA